MNIKVYAIAKSQKEANELALEGYGFTSRSEAEKVLEDDTGIDPYYKSLLRVYESEP